jgi:hypothetical protein
MSRDKGPLIGVGQPLADMIGSRRAHFADQYEEYDEHQDLTQRFWSSAPVGRMSGAVRFLRRTFRQPSGRSSCGGFWRINAIASDGQPPPNSR